MRAGACHSAVLTLALSTLVLCFARTAQATTWLETLTHASAEGSVDIHGKVDGAPFFCYSSGGAAATVTPALVTFSLDGPPAMRTVTLSALTLNVSHLPTESTAQPASCSFPNSTSAVLSHLDISDYVLTVPESQGVLDPFTTKAGVTVTIHE